MKRFIPFVQGPPVVAVIRLTGSIGLGGRAALSDNALRPVIERAFRRGKPKAVALVINSPGGSPVQSALIAARIRGLAEKHKLPVHAFVEDVAASGGYWLAAAADDIWADAGSIVGSIGVISAGFGAHDLIERYGIERRVFTSAKSKSILDPFLPQKEEDVEILKGLLEEMHSGFVSYVQQRRGDKLSDDEHLFSGRFWLGGTARELGLIDGIAHPEDKLRELYGDKSVFLRYGPRRGLMQRLSASVVTDVMADVEDRASFARYGL
ncbi:MAG: S49 family peptidase [Sediminimonas sp.]|uniref:S49 family peptidase n=1 Tax=Sediminimonas sp. TaxID=2823379 RepID=UPI00287074FE|nr:S49 family peptidase [Sediminimonas sp.]MDR9484554.1 S49 family peptidase [Sediminimonas sp.]